MSAHMPSSLALPPCAPGRGSQPAAPGLLHRGPRLPISCAAAPLSPVVGSWARVQGGRGMDMLTVCISGQGKAVAVPVPGWQRMVPFSGQLGSCVSLLPTPIQVPSASWHRSNDILGAHLPTVGLGLRPQGRGDAWLQFHGCWSLVGGRRNLAALCLLICRVCTHSACVPVPKSV